MVAAMSQAPHDRVNPGEGVPGDVPLCRHTDLDAIRPNGNEPQTQIAICSARQLGECFREIRTPVIGGIQTVHDGHVRADGSLTKEPQCGASGHQQEPQDNPADQNRFPAAGHFVFPCWRLSLHAA